MFQEVFTIIHSPYSWVLYFLCAFLIGISKTGIPNLGTLAIPVFVFLFGAKESTGIVLILLCFADLVAVIYYRKKFLWHEVVKLLPMALLGLVVALILGNYINDKTFKIVIGLCIVVGMIIMFWTHKSTRLQHIVDNKWYSPFFGFLMGFSTMIGNAAGPALSVYMLSLRLDKISFTATAAWFIMILNFTKIPLQLFVWHNLTWKGLLINFLAIPFILLGSYVGILILKKLPEDKFVDLVMFLVVVSGLMLMV